MGSDRAKSSSLSLANASTVRSVSGRSCAVKATHTLHTVHSREHCGLLSADGGPEALRPCSASLRARIRLKHRLASGFRRGEHWAPTSTAVYEQVRASRCHHPTRAAAAGAAERAGGSCDRHHGRTGSMLLQRHFVGGKQARAFLCVQADETLRRSRLKARAPECCLQVVSPCAYYFKQCVQQPCCLSRKSGRRILQVCPERSDAQAT